MPAPDSKKQRFIPIQIFDADAAEDAAHAGDKYEGSSICLGPTDPSPETRAAVIRPDEVILPRGAPFTLRIDYKVSGDVDCVCLKLHGGSDGWTRWRVLKLILAVYASLGDDADDADLGDRCHDAVLEGLRKRGDVYTVVCSS